MELPAVSGWQLRGGEPVTGEVVRLERVATRGESQPTRELRGLREKKVFTPRELGTAVHKTTPFSWVFFKKKIIISETTLFCLKNKKENIRNDAVLIYT